MKRIFAVIGVGNMAKAILNGLIASPQAIDQYVLFDKNEAQYDPDLTQRSDVRIAHSVADAIQEATVVLLAVKPQNYNDVFAEISTVPNHQEKLYLSIGAGIAVDTVSKALSTDQVVRILPNVPMLIGQGVSLICKNAAISPESFRWVCSVFESTGSILLIDEKEMNRMIGVTSSSPAYVFRFIHAIEQAAVAQGLEIENLRQAICDVVIGSALLLKQSDEPTDSLVRKVASKGGTTEKALEQLDLWKFDTMIKAAMLACTDRADELGGNKKES